jgi:DUF971 family protein
MSEAKPWPTELKLNAAKTLLAVSFDTGERFDLPAEYLRVESPSAEVQGHGPGQRETVAAKRGIAITALQPVGNYAVRIVFADGHDSGLYTWAYLHELGREYDSKWPAYLEELVLKGLTRG